jgi:hypothetical protein
MGVGAIVLVVLVAFHSVIFILEPREVTAENEMYKSQAFLLKILSVLRSKAPGVRINRV